MYLIVWALLPVQGCYHSVANSGQNFPDNPGERFGRWGKIQFRPPVIFTFWKAFGLKKKTVSVYIYEWEKYNISWTLLEFERSKTNFSAPFRPFLYKILCVRSAFIRPLLSYVAEQSASWQQCRLKIEKSSPAYEAHDGDEGADDNDDDEWDVDDRTAANHHDKNG